MSLIEVLLIAVGVSMDAFAVSVAKGISASRITLKHALIAGLWFGGFQALMPTIGYFLGISFSSLISGWDHWIAFVLLTLIGANMVRGSFSNDEEENVAHGFGFWVMFSLAIATSIDALAVGISFAMVLKLEQLPLAVLLIGVVTFILSAIGVKIGNVFGAKHKSKAELAGGIILFLIGLKILFEHLGIINF
jgi:putative Mn2+ efflux pump MntP